MSAVTQHMATLGEELEPDQQPILKSKTLIAVLLLLTLTIVAGAIYVMNCDAFPDKDIKYIPPLLSLLVAALFSSAPLLTCFAHTISIKRQQDKLAKVLAQTKDTQYFKIAQTTLKSVQPASVEEAGFLLPILLFSAIVIFCSLVSFMSLFWPNLFGQKTPLLGGLHVIGMTDPQDIGSYQSGTMVVAAVAFVGAYLALFNRLLNQINNSDIYPISFHYFSVWLITAMVLAAIARHSASAMHIPEVAVLPVAFAIGAMPAPFFAAFIHWSLNRLGITGDKGNPSGDDMPTNLSLLMIDGLADEKIDRLSELGVSNAQILACQNPFMLWVRLPYDFGLIVDWIAQAQLYLCLRETGFKKARSKQVGDIHKFVAVLSNQRAADSLCKELDLDSAYVAPLLASLHENPSFVRLREVKCAMLPRPFASSTNDAGAPARSDDACKADATGPSSPPSVVYSSLYPSSGMPCSAP